MKLMKTKLGLSVLALALVGAGAWSLQSPVTASAEVDMSGFKMENGASVCLSGVDVNENEFNGIRWTTTVEPSFYTSAGATQNSEFGVIVAPTGLFTGELTFETTLTNGSQVKKLPVKGIDAGSEAQKYYSVIDYSELGDASEAYKMELTARAYVDVDGDGDYSDCIYADMTGINTSRSARQVAVSAELAGVVESANMAKAKEYYGADENVTANVDFVKNTGAKGTQYIDMVNDTTVDVAITVDGTIEEVLIGSKSVGYEYNDGTLTLSNLDDIVCGEQYVTVFTDNGIVTKPIIGATKVIDSVDDLKMFNAKGTGATIDTDGDKVVDTFKFEYTIRKDYIANWSSDQEQGGYYLLKNDIEAEGYKHGSRNTYEPKEGETVKFNNGTWNGAKAYRGLPIGLTGTFNGMGYAIKDMEIATELEGFFGIVNGGTVKNVAFTDVKSALTEHAYVVANYLLDATLENVYIKTDEYVADADDDGVAESIGFPMTSSAGIANYYYGQTSMKSCVVDFSLSSESGSNATNMRKAGTGIFFASYQDDYGVDDNGTKPDCVLNCTDVYGVSANTLGSAYPHMFVQKGIYDSTNKTWKTDEGIVMGDMVDAELIPTGTNTPNKKRPNCSDNCPAVRAHGDKRHFISGAHRSHSLTCLANEGHSFESLTASGCWSVVGNLPVWGS